MTKDFKHPDRIDCEEHCEVPEGVTMTEVPRPRHAWSDIIHCPWCPRSFLWHREEREPFIGEGI